MGGRTSTAVDEDAKQGENFKSILLDFDILIVSHELSDTARHVTRQRARPPITPITPITLKLGICTDAHMTTLFTTLIKNHNKTGYLVNCLNKSNNSPNSITIFIRA